MSKKRNGRLPLSQVPCLGAICDALGFQNLKDANNFTVLTHKWRSTYTTVDNLPGSGLVEWNCPKTRENLATMSKTFLDREIYGKEYWPCINGTEENDEESCSGSRTAMLPTTRNTLEKRGREISFDINRLFWPHQKELLLAFSSVADTQSIVNAVMDDSASQVPDDKNSERITDDGSRCLIPCSKPKSRRSLRRQSPAASSSVPKPPADFNRISSKNPHQIRFSPPPANLSSPVGPLAKASFQIPFQIPFHIRQHKDGVTCQTCWGNGRFGNKTLEEFLGDLAEKQKCQPRDIMMIKVVLRLGLLEIDVDVGPGREDAWNMVKESFRAGDDGGGLQWVGREDELGL
ncbi:hypothetical protein O988_06250 [Pseudogymnoascus sp. VKM F-3808]|nr:hypothetical protein O988_06250 [Pseudogymnoascus sp. VKM F-3808]